MIRFAAMFLTVIALAVASIAAGSHVTMAHQNQADGHERADFVQISQPQTGHCEDGQACAAKAAIYQFACINQAVTLTRLPPAPTPLELAIDLRIFSDVVFVGRMPAPYERPPNLSLI